MYKPPISEFVPTIRSVRKSTLVPVFDSNGKKLYDEERSSVQRVEVLDDPNAGLIYTDFTVEASQRLGVNLSPVPTHQIAASPVQLQSAREYLDSDELQTQLNDSLTTNSNNDGKDN